MYWIRRMLHYKKKKKPELVNSYSTFLNYWIRSRTLQSANLLIINYEQPVIRCLGSMYGFGGITILREVKDWATEEMKKMGISSKYGTTKDSGGASAWISLTMGSNLDEGGEGEGRKGVAYSKKWQVSLCVTLHGAETLNIHSYLCVLLWLAVGDLLKLWHERSDNYT